jgi:hypothetical protein
LGASRVETHHRPRNGTTKGFARRCGTRRRIGDQAMVAIPHRVSRVGTLFVVCGDNEEWVISRLAAVDRRWQGHCLCSEFRHTIDSKNVPAKDFTIRRGARLRLGDQGTVAIPHRVSRVGTLCATCDGGEEWEISKPPSGDPLGRTPLRVSRVGTHNKHQDAKPTGFAKRRASWPAPWRSHHSSAIAQECVPTRDT